MRDKLTFRVNYPIFWIFCCNSTNRLKWWSWWSGIIQGQKQLRPLCWAHWSVESQAIGLKGGSVAKDYSSGFLSFRLTNVFLMQTISVVISQAAGWGKEELVPLGEGGGEDCWWW